MIEQVEYDPYGRVRRTALGDFDHDGAIVTADIFANLAAFNAPSPAADHDWDGAVAPSDIFAFLAHWFAADATPRDQLSSSGPGGHDNPIGYCGYYHDRETVGIMGERNGGLYQVRHRVYDPHAGRWLQRDPAGFVDGMNLYEYVRGQVGALLDAFGLSCGDSEPTPTQSLFDRAKQWMHKQVQRVVDHIIDSTENPVIEEVTYVVAGIADTIHDTILDTASSGLDPESPDPGVQAGQQAAQQEMNHAARAGRDPSIVNVVMEMLADLSGGNDLARAIYGYDSLEDRILTAEERVAAGLRGGGTTTLICVGCGSRLSNTRLAPHPEATGSHTTFLKDKSGRVIKYQHWEKNTRNPIGFEPGRRYDGFGDAHYNKVTKKDVPTPHVRDPATPGGVRPPEPGEVPK